MSVFGTDYGTSPEDKGLHRIVKWLSLFCLFGLVLEGAFFIPLMVIWYGWPTLSVQEMCDEMHKVIYDDPSRTCEFPYEPLAPSEPRRYKAYLEDITGPSSPVTPMPRYQRIGFRELVENRNKRLAEEAAASK